MALPDSDEQFDRPYHQTEARSIVIAYFTDPFETYVALY